MMSQFQRVYWPGGMSIERSGWWLVHVWKYAIIKLRRFDDEGARS